MTKYIQTKDELLTHLREQVDFMISSAVSYDNGFEGEAKRLAVAIRILVYDTSSCTSLLTQLRKMDILFYDSAAAFDPRNLATSNCLTMMKLSVAGAEYVAPLDNLSSARNKDKKVSFVRWWNRTPMYKDNADNIFTRRDLVLAVANKEGGAHIDPKLDQAYADLSRFNSLGWKAVISGVDQDFKNTPVPPSVRQIAHEIIKTLKEGVLDLFTDKAPILKQFEVYEKHCLMRSKQLGFIKEVPHAQS